MPSAHLCIGFAVQYTGAIGNLCPLPSEGRDNELDDFLFGIAAFRSRQQVLKFESALSRAGVPVKVISTPRDVAVGCGLSVQFGMEDVDRVQSVLNSTRPGNLIGVYQVDRRSGGRTQLTALSLR